MRCYNCGASASWSFTQHYSNGDATYYYCKEHNPKTPKSGISKETFEQLKKNQEEPQSYRSSFRNRDF